MDKLAKKWKILAWALVALAGGLLITWLALTYEPEFYHRALEQLAQQRGSPSNGLEAKGLQLRNDIANAPQWEALFWDGEINSWLSEHGSSFLPAGPALRVSEPCVVFEPGHVLAACRCQRGPARVVVWLAARIEAPTPDEVIVNIEKARIGILPIPPESILSAMTGRTSIIGGHTVLEKRGGDCVVHVRTGGWFAKEKGHIDRIEVLEGHIRLLGRSHRAS